jgi:hypothetical protein
MSANAENIKNQINTWVRNYAVPAFHNMRLNAILLQMVDLCDAAGSGIGGTGSVIVELTSANFVNDTDCPLTSLAGQNLAIFWNELQRFLVKADGEWSDLPGGGFKVNMAGFEASSNNYHLYAYVL